MKPKRIKEFVRAFNVDGSVVESFHSKIYNDISDKHPKASEMEVNLISEQRTFKFLIQNMKQEDHDISNAIMIGRLADDIFDLALTFWGSMPEYFIMSLEDD